MSIVRRHRRSVCGAVALALVVALPAGPVLDEAGSGDFVRLPAFDWRVSGAAAAELPRRNPRRVAQPKDTADAAAAERPALAASSAIVSAASPDVVSAASPAVISEPAVAPRPTFGVPFPIRRPGTAQTVETAREGEAVSLPPAAFAPSSGGAVASLFDAAEAAAQGTEPPPAPAAIPMVVASVAGTGQAASPAAASPEPETVYTRDPNAFLGQGVRSGNLKGALDALRADRYQDALARRNGLKDPLDRAIVDYFLVRSGASVVTSAMVMDFAARGEEWPNRMVRSRLEAAVLRDRTAPAKVIEMLGGRASTAPGARALGRAYLALGDRDKAQRVVRTAWRDTPMGGRLQRAFGEEFAALLTAEAHLDRADRLVGKRRYKEAEALRARLGAAPRAYLDARLAAARGESGAAKKLERLSAAMKRRPGYALALAETKHKRDEFGAAARLIEGVNARSVVDGDGWWTETRIVARALAERGKARRAYKLAARGTAESAKERADEAFHAGWFALTGLKDGRAAERHFAALAKIATTPLTKSRAAYWRGRAAAERGDQGAAKRHYGNAAKLGFTYYGQLARVELGRSGTGVRTAPRPTAADSLAFRRHPVANAIRRLKAAGHDHRIVPLIRHLADTLPTAGQVALAVKLAEEAKMPHIALMAAKRAQRRGVNVGRLAYPTAAIPRSATMPKGLDKALVFAIARQESMFNPAARSPVGATGLMQVMPRTGRAMARELGLRHSQRKLTRDPAYNTTLGAAYLSKRLAEFGGSYVMTFAAYNAGAGRVREWVERFGDPRRPDIDPIDWVERIPFPETRNYVMRVMENVQVYREALGVGQMAIERDLSRGRPG